MSHPHSPHDQGEFAVVTPSAAWRSKGSLFQGLRSFTTRGSGVFLRIRIRNKHEQTTPNAHSPKMENIRPPSWMAFCSQTSVFLMFSTIAMPKMRQLQCVGSDGTAISRKPSATTWRPGAGVAGASGRQQPALHPSGSRTKLKGLGREDVSIGQGRSPVRQDKPLEVPLEHVVGTPGSVGGSGLHWLLNPRWVSSV